MVSVAFKTLSLFLALVTLPQVFAWSIEEETLANHSLARALQNAPALTWSANLAASAQARSNLCRPGKVGTPFGENTAIASSVTAAVVLWEKDYKLYNPKNPNNVFTPYTQMIWRHTTEVGCAIATCAPGALDPKNKVTFVTCQYNPPGNVPGLSPSQTY